MDCLYDTLVILYHVEIIIAIALAVVGVAYVIIVEVKDRWW